MKPIDDRSSYRVSIYVVIPHRGKQGPNLGPCPNLSFNSQHARTYNFERL